MPISDLTGTTWEYECKQSITTSGGPIIQGSVYITGSVNNDAIFQIYEVGYRTAGNFYMFQVNNGADEVVFSKDIIGGVRNGVVGDTYIISITGGDDATNSNLITWLTANATQIVEPTPSTTNNIFFGNSTIDKIYFGTSEVSKIYYGNTLIYEVGGGSND